MSPPDPEVRFSHLDTELFDGAGVTKGELVGYLDQVADRLLPELAGRPVSVVRVRPGSAPFMQKNLPGYAPDWVARTTVWAEASHREVTYAVADDRPTLAWLANQRAVEFHVPTTRIAAPDSSDVVVLDLDPPEGAPFAAVVHAATVVRATLAAAGLAAAVKTSGAKGLHVVVPLAAGHPLADVAAATRALSDRSARSDPARLTTAFLRADRGGRVFVDPTRTGSGTLVACYSPRARPGLPVSFPVGWPDLDAVFPADFTVRTVPPLLASSDPRDPWLAHRPPPQRLPADLVAEGHTLPVPRVQAMHEGRRRARAARRPSD